MQQKRRSARLHPRNKNREQYDISSLIATTPKLAKLVKPNKLGKDSIDFSDPTAVRILNEAILKYYYKITYWKFPEKNLCPPIPGRADYIHYIADLLSENNSNIIPRGKKITCFDIGVGANCIYPIIGIAEYDWNFIASDIDSKSIKSAKHIVQSNSLLNNRVRFFLQESSKNTFYGAISKDDKIDISTCNPPFHSSAGDAQKETRRKIKNLTGKNNKRPTLNFAGVSNELICDGGEYKFITNMIKESVKFSTNFYWFTTLVSKQSNLKGIYKALEKHNPQQVKTIEMGTGNKTSRIVAWTFLSKDEQKKWQKERWTGQ